MQRHRCHAEQSEASRIFQIVTKVEILRLRLQNDITTQALRGGKNKSIKSKKMGFVVRRGLDQLFFKAVSFNGFTDLNRHQILSDQQWTRVIFSCGREQIFCTGAAEQQ